MAQSLNTTHQSPITNLSPPTPTRRLNGQLIPGFDLQRFFAGQWLAV
jgi:hypothetical protein